MRERLREVAKERARPRIDLFGIQPDVIRMAQKGFEQRASLIGSVGREQRVDKPEAGYEKRAFLAGKAVVKTFNVTLDKIKGS